MLAPFRIRVLSCKMSFCGWSSGEAYKDHFEEGRSRAFAQRSPSNGGKGGGTGLAVVEMQAPVSCVQ